MTEEQNPTKYLGNELDYLQRVLNAESWSSTGGSWTQELEKRFAEYVGSAYAVAMNSGTSTLHAALEACGVSPGDEVISPALTVIMDTTSTLHALAVPVYADVDPQTFNIDVEDVRRKISPKTRAIIAVSLYGLPADLDALRSLADETGIPLIEDNAQGVGASIRGRAVGSWGDVSSWSFENTKHLSAGEGGMVTTDSANLAQAMRKLGGHGFKNLGPEEGRVRLNQEIFQDPDYKRHDVLGWNYRMPEFIAAVALAQLERVSDLVALRETSAHAFLDVMKDCPYLVPQLVPEGWRHSYYTLGVRFLADVAGISWQEFRRRYVARGGDGIYGAWSVPYLEPVMSSGAFRRRAPEIYRSTSYQVGTCQVAEFLQPQIMQFKTNYRDVSLARTKAEILAETIESI